MDYALGAPPEAGPSSNPLIVAPMDVTPPSTTINGTVPEHLSAQSRNSSVSGYVYDPLMMLHKSAEDDGGDNDDGHPEVPQRIESIHNAFKAANLIPQRMTRIATRPVEHGECILVHSEDLWERVLSIQNMSAEQMQSSATYYEHLSLYVHESTTQCARLSCGSTIEAVKAVASGRMRNAFAIVRPPGHHAEPEEHMGFCFFNNVAVAVRVAQQENLAKKVLILDWDVHHGNGTQRAFWDDPTVLYMSLHRYDGGAFYPGGSFGSMEMCGEGPGMGTSVNVPWPEPGMGDADYLYAFQNIIMPIAYEFAPDLVIISAGFDAAAGDPLGMCNVTPTGYAHMTYMLSSLAGGKCCVVLEGGYKLDAIAHSAVAVAKILVGEAPPPLPSMVASEVATQTVWLCSQVQSRHWKSITPQGLQPPEELADATFTVSDILTVHRARHLYDTYSMLDIPFSDPTMKELFKGQCLCSSDIFSNTNTTLVLVHDLGDLRLQHRTVASIDVDIEKSYMLDATDRVIKWALEKNWAVVDLSVMDKPVQGTARVDSVKTAEKKVGAVLEHIWDNYLQLGDSKNVVLMSYGLGMGAVNHLLKSRVVTDKARATIHVIGNDTWPVLSNLSQTMQEWWKENSFTVLNANHPNLQEKKLRKRLGQHLALDQPQLVKLLASAVPQIETFLHSKLRLTGNFDASYSLLDSDMPSMQAVAA